MVCERLREVTVLRARMLCCHLKPLLMTEQGSGPGGDSEEGTRGGLGRASEV